MFISALKGFFGSLFLWVCRLACSAINLEPTYLRQMQSGKLFEEQLLEMVELYNNIGKAYRIILQPVK